MVTGATLLLVFLGSVVVSETIIDVCGLITKYQYPCEEHVATTSDGWNLSIQRIPYSPKSPPSTNTSKPVLFFQHGLLDSAASWTLNGPPLGLPYFLADNGFDVWMGNNRGNSVSMNNSLFNENEVGFWNWTFDEMASIDMPTQLGYVLNTTGVSTLAYMGHSEGTTQAFAALSTNTELASHINLFIALAPVTYIHNTNSTIVRVSSDLYLEQILYLFDQKGVSIPDAVEKYLPEVCKFIPRFCDDIFEQICGPTQNINATQMSYILTYFPTSSSALNIVHWAQEIQKPVFQKYDFGSAALNEQHYNQPTPPPYSLTFPSTLNIALFTGGNDYLADPVDVQILLSKLQPAPVLVHTEPTFAHMDFILGDTAYKTIYPIIFQLLQKFST